MNPKKEILLSAWASFFVAHGLAVRRISLLSEKSVPLTLDEYDVLLTVQRSPGGLRLAALADATVFTRSGISRIIKRLESKGLMVRARCASDGRGAYACISEAGEEALKQSWVVYSQEILELFACFTEKEGEQLSDLMERLIGQVKQEPLIGIGKKIARK